MENQSIICFANDWQSDPTSKHQVMKILAASNRILWVDSVGMRRPSLTRSDARRVGKKVRRWFRGLTRVNENLHHFEPFVLPFHASPLARAINKRLLLGSIAGHVKRLDMQDVQLWTFFPNTVDVVGHLGEKLVVYYCVDQWSKFSFIHGESMEKMERRLLRRADLVITTAEHLFRDKAPFNPNTHLVTHGVDHAFFSRALQPGTKDPGDLRRVGKPRIGFFGLIHEWIDLELIARVASEKPQWSIVLIGDTAVDVSSLKGFHNIHFLGRKPYEWLPAYCRVFDAGIIPFRVNELTLNVNPIKLKEYLAAGLPVVSTALPEAQKLGDLVEVGKNPDEFIRRLELALAEDTPDKRIARSQRMKSETWEKKVEQISSLVSMSLERKLG